MKWTEEEVRTLAALVSQNEKSYVSWKAVSQAIGTKSPRQCFDRYLYIQKMSGSTTQSKRKNEKQEGGENRYYSELLEQLRNVIESTFSK